MIFSGDALAEYLHGAAQKTVKDGLLCPRKCSPAVTAFWASRADWLEDMALHTSGIRLEFSTDAPSVTFSVEGGEFDLWADGNLLCHTSEKERHDISADLPNSPAFSRVTLVFPNCKQGRVAFLRADGTLKPVEFEKKFLFLGDSITQGFNGVYPSLSYPHRVAQFYGADLMVQGIGGGFFHPDSFEAPKDFTPDRVFIALGTNDMTWGWSREEGELLAAAHFDKVKDAYGAEKIVFILPIWRGDRHKDSHRFPQWFHSLRVMAQARGFTVIDGMDLVPHSSEFFSPDKLHPNDLGFSLYGENLIKALRQGE